MRFSRIIAAALLLVGALFACQKDQLQTASSLPYEDSHEYHQAIDGMEVFADLKELRGTYPLAADLVQGELTKMSAAKDLREYTVTNIVATQDGNGGHLFTGFLDAFRGNIYKLIFQTDASERVINLGVLEIELSPEYLREYFADNSTFGNVTGSVKGLTPEGFLEKTETNNETIADCWEVVFNGGRGVRGEVVNGGSGNGSGNGGLSPGGVLGGDSGWSPDYWQLDCTLRIMVYCGCEHHPGGRNGAICREGTRCYKDDILVPTLICESPGRDSETDTAPSVNEKNEYWDCVNLLTSAGLLTESDLHKQRLMDCAGLGDPYDVGGNPSAEHPDASFCTAWNNYVTRCLPGVPFRAVVETWGELMYQNNEAFEYILENDNSCGGAAIANLILENPELELEEEEVCVLLINNGLTQPISDFLEDKGQQEKEDAMAVVHALLYPNTNRCTNGNTPDLVNDINEFWEERYSDISDNSYLVDALTYYLYARDFYDLGDFDEFVEEFEANEEEIIPRAPLTNGEIWARARSIKDRLIDQHPEQESKINNFFVCRVLGPAFEEAVLNCLSSFTSRNSQLPGSDYTVRPDGYNAISFRGAHSEWVVNGAHIITEVKTKFTSPSVFNWSSNPNQLNEYLRFLNTHQYEGQSPNTLFLVMPSGISIDPAIISRCTQNNVHLLTASMEIAILDPNLVRVANVVSHNHHNLMWHPDQIETMIRLFPENSVDRGTIGGPFEYYWVDFQEILERKAAIFEQTYLVGNTQPACPDE